MLCKGQLFNSRSALDAAPKVLYRMCACACLQLFQSRSGLSQMGTPVAEMSYYESAGSIGSKLTASNLTEFDALQRHMSRKDRPRSGLHGEPPAGTSLCYLHM